MEELVKAVYRQNELLKRLADLFEERFGDHYEGWKDRADRRLVGNTIWGNPMTLGEVSRATSIPVMDLRSSVLPKLIEEGLVSHTKDCATGETIYGCCDKGTGRLYGRAHSDDLAVRNALTDGPLTRAQICKVVGFGLGRVDQSLQRLVDAGKVESCEKSTRDRLFVYRLTDWQ